MRKFLFLFNLMKDLRHVQLILNMVGVHFPWSVKSGNIVNNALKEKATCCWSHGAIVIISSIIIIIIIISRRRRIGGGGPPGPQWLILIPLALAIGQHGCPHDPIWWALLWSVLHLVANIGTDNCISMSHDQPGTSLEMHRMWNLLANADKHPCFIQFW